MEDSLKKRVVGQDLVLSAFSDAQGVINIKFGECMFNDLFVGRNLLDGIIESFGWFLV